MNKKSTIEIISWSAIILAPALNYWHALRGYPSPDSSFYIETAYRFYQGDIPVIHEWHPSQLGALLLIPFVKLFFFMHSDTEGIILYFRMVYFLINALTGIFVYLKTRRETPMVLFPVLIILLFTMGGEMIPNYNTLGLTNVILSSVLLFFPVKPEKLSYIISGIFYAFAFLCAPFMMLPYAAAAVYIACRMIRKDEGIKDIAEIWLFFTSGAVLAAVIVTVFFLKIAPFSQYLESLPYLFYDPAYQSSGILLKTIKLIKNIWIQTKLSAVLFPVYMYSAYLLYRNHTQGKPVQKYLMFFLVMTALMLGGYRNSICNYGNILFIPFGAAGFYLGNQKEKKILMMWLFGVCYVFMINLGSDTLLNSASMAAVACSLPSVIMFDRMLDSIIDETAHRVRTIFAVVLLCFVIEDGYDRLTRIYGDISPLKLHTLIEFGPAKGLYTTNDRAERYNTLINVFDRIPEDTEYVFVCSNQSLPYLYMQKRISCFSGWFRPVSTEEIQRLRMYLDLFPDKKPDTAFIEKNYEYYEEVKEVLSESNPDVIIIDY